MPAGIHDMTHSLFLRFALQKQYAYDDQFVAVNSTNQPHPDTNSIVGDGTDSSGTSLEHKKMGSLN